MHAATRLEFEKSNVKAAGDEWRPMSIYISRAVSSYLYQSVFKDWIGFGLTRQFKNS
jgi:hypothetical protein